MILPYGHDQNVYGRQWITIGLIAVNVLVFALTFLLGPRADRDVDAALATMESVSERYPDARVTSAAVASLPPSVRNSQPFVSDDPEDLGEPGEPELRWAVGRLVAASDAMPMNRFGYRPGKPTVTTLVTHTFLHADLTHLAGNMLFLWLAGLVVECFWEHLAFLGLYLLAGVAGAAAHHLSAPGSMVPMVGASGAIAGLLGAFLVGHPRAKIKILYGFLLFRGFVGRTAVPAWLLIPGWLLLQLGYGLFDRGAGGVAYWAHVGGFALGIVAALGMRWGGWVAVDGERPSLRRG